MTGKTFIITSDKFFGSLVYKYDADGVLRVWENKATLTDEQLQWFANRLPTVDIMVPMLIEQGNKKLKLQELPPDLSFDAFWQAYDNKKGSKLQAQKIWDGKKATESGDTMTEADKLAVFKCLPKLKYSYQVKNKELPYPTTFLNQRRWENEY